MLPESSEFLSQYGQIGIFLLFALLFSLIGLSFAWFVRSRNNDPIFRTTYECGSEPVGTPWIQHNVRFYLFAMLFVIFDVETLYIYPWAVVYKNLGITGFIEMFVFITVLFLGLIYAWRKGTLKWE